MERIRTAFASAQCAPPEDQIVENTLSDKSGEDNITVGDFPLDQITSRVPDLAETCLRQLDTLESIHTRLPRLRQRCGRLAALLGRIRDQWIEPAKATDPEKRLNPPLSEPEPAPNHENVNFDPADANEESDSCETHPTTEAMEYPKESRASDEMMQVQSEAKESIEIPDPTDQLQETIGVFALSDSVGSDDRTDSADDLLDVLNGLDEELLQSARATERAVRELFGADDEPSDCLREIEENTDQAQDLGLALTMGKRRRPDSTSRSKSVGRILDELHGKAFDWVGLQEGHEPAAYEDWLAELKRIEADLNGQA